MEPEEVAIDRDLKKKVATKEWPILAYFSFMHLPENLRGVSMSFARQALFITENTFKGAEQTVALRKLLESKDAAVRARL